MRQPSMSVSSASAGQSPALIARVNEKKAELENLRELRDLSAAVASQMEALEEKLATLSDGTEGTYAVLVVLVRSQDSSGRGLTQHARVSSDCTCRGKLAECLARHQHGIVCVPAWSGMVMQLSG